MVLFVIAIFFLYQSQLLSSSLIVKRLVVVGQVNLSLSCWMSLLVQDLAGAVDEVDVAKFTDAVKEFDSMTKLVCQAFILCSYKIIIFRLVVSDFI